MSLLEMTGFILKVDYFGESSLLNYIYTNFMGLTKAVLKGGRKQKMRTTSSVEPMTEVEMVLYKKSGRDLHYIKNINTIHSFKNIRTDPDKLMNCLFIAEHILTLSPPEEPNMEVHHLLAQTLSNVSESYGKIGVLTLHFRVRLLKIMGTLPLLQFCSRCGSELTEIVSLYIPEEGGLICKSCITGEILRNQQPIKVRNSVLQMLDLFTRIDEHKLSTIAPTIGMIEEANRLLSYHINYHHETIFKTERFLKGLGGGE